MSNEKSEQERIDAFVVAIVSGPMGPIIYEEMRQNTLQFADIVAYAARELAKRSKTEQKP